jgi:hypothetical protein
MPSARLGPRTSMFTSAQPWDRNTAAFPAEFAPPLDGDLLTFAQLGFDVRRAAHDARSLETGSPARVGLRYRALLAMTTVLVRTVSSLARSIR